MDHPIRSKIGRKKVNIIQEMLTTIESYMLLKKNLSTRLDNSLSVETHSSRPTGKKSYWQRDKYNRGIHGQYDKYTPLTVSQEKIYQNRAKAEFWKEGVWPLIPSGKQLALISWSIFSSIVQPQHGRLHPTKGRARLSEYVNGDREIERNHLKVNPLWRLHMLGLAVKSSWLVKESSCTSHPSLEAHPKKISSPKGQWRERSLEWWLSTKRMQIRWKRFLIGPYWGSEIQIMFEEVFSHKGVPSIAAYLYTPNRRSSFIPLFVCYWLGDEFNPHPENKYNR